jgi:hypothetical protein
MASYLIRKDYERCIQKTELDSITSLLTYGQTYADSIRSLVEGSVIREMSAYLIQKFDLAQEFQDTAQWVRANTYKTTNRIFLDAVAYSATASSYNLNDLTLYSNNVYINKTAIVAPEAFDAAKWTLLGAQYDLFYVAFPYPEFAQFTIYKKGDIVYWKNKIYRAAQDSIVVDQQMALQSVNYSDFTTGNVLPDDTVNGSSMWGTGIAYSFATLAPTNPAATAWSNVTAYTAGTLVSYNSINYVATAASTNIIPGTDFTKWAPASWTLGDNRNQMFVSMMLDMVVYNLCKRIAPNNVPEARHNCWINAMKNLKAMAEGDINAQLPVIQPAQGNKIRFGGKTKQVNDY